MFYVDKKNHDNVVELIHSEQGVVIVIDQEDTIAKGRPVGRIIKKGKKEFKKQYKKIKNNSKLVLMEPISEAEKDELLNMFETDKVGILRYTEDYVDSKMHLDRLEEINSMNEEEYKKLLKELADPVPNK